MLVKESRLIEDELRHFIEGGLGVDKRSLLRVQPIFTNVLESIASFQYDQYCSSSNPPWRIDPQIPSLRRAMFRACLPRNAIDMIKSMHIAEQLDIICYPTTL